MSTSADPRVEEDLDDLDDVLDQFSPPAQPAPAPPQPVADGAEFEAKLAEGMESLFRDLALESGARSERERLAAAWEAMLVEGMDGASEPSASSPGPSDADFQSRIRSTMSRLRESESGLQPPASGDGDTIQSLLSQLGDLSGAGGENTEQLQGALEAMMGQLMSRDVLYEPLKELHDKFPEYLSKNASTLSSEDRARFEAQIVCIKQLLDQFEAKTYRDDDEGAREKIVELMGELQTHGSPPDDMIGPLPPGISMGADGLPDMEGCNLN